MTVAERIKESGWEDEIEGRRIETDALSDHTGKLDDVNNAAEDEAAGEAMNL